MERAKAVRGPAIVFTFDPHPVRLLRPEQCPPPLTWTERKAQLLQRPASIGSSPIRPTRRCLNFSAQDFFETIVRGTLASRAMVEGANFYFGHNREGTIGRLQS